MVFAEGYNNQRRHTWTLNLAKAAHQASATQSTELEQLQQEMNPIVAMELQLCLATRSAHKRIVESLTKSQNFRPPGQPLSGVT